MKRTGKKILLCACLLFCLLSLRAQTTTLFAPTLSVDPGTTFKAELKVSDFSMIIGLQFSIRWDSTVLRFNRVQDFGLEDITAEDNFGYLRTPGGVLSFFWFDPSVMGITLPDSSTIFSIEFEAIGEPNVSSTLSFTGDPTPVEVADTSNSPIDVELLDGMIQLNNPSASLFNNAPEIITIKKNFPNPFTEYTTVRFELRNAADTRLSIHNVQGQPLYEEHRQFTRGPQLITLKKDIFPQPGTYYLRMSSADFLVTLKLIYL